MEKISYENYKRATEEDWEDIFFQVTDKPLLDAKAEWDLVLPCNEIFKTEDRAVMNAIRRMDVEEGLLKQNKRTGQIAMLTNTLGFLDNKMEFVYTTRQVHYPIIYQGDTYQISNDSEVFEMAAIHA